MRVHQCTSRLEVEKAKVAVDPTLDKEDQKERDGMWLRTGDRNKIEVKKEEVVEERRKRTREEKKVTLYTPANQERLAQHEDIEYHS